VLTHDRVTCDICEQDMGQLHRQPASAPDLIADQRTAPYFTVCPDCYACSVPADQNQNQAFDHA